MNVDYIIVGQGVAGVSIAFRLLERGQSIIAFDAPEKNLCSRIAAGLCNPLTARTLSLSWQAENFFPALQDFYTGYEKIWRKKFFFPMPIYLPFVNEAEQTLWQKRIPNPEQWVQSAINSPVVGPVHNPLGGLTLRRGGYIDMNTFLQSACEALRQREAYQHQSVDSAELIFTEEGVRYKTWKAKKIIYCVGLGQVNHVHVPTIPLKGEILTISVNEEFSMIYNRGVFLAPQPDGRHCKVGATYEHTTTEGVTETGRQTLAHKLEQLINRPYKITAQDWGLRPTTRDRRPIMGECEKRKNLIIFTGLGTRGISSAPYLSALLADSLLCDGEIPREISINRFY